MQGRLIEINLIPTKIAKLGNAKPVTVSHQDHGRVTLRPTVRLHRGDQLVDLGFRQVLAGAQFRVLPTPRRDDCPIYSIWYD